MAFSSEVVLFAAVLVFAAVVLWVLFGWSANIAGEKANAIIIGSVVLVLLMVMLLLHFG